LHELLVATDALKKLIQEHARVAEIVAVALEEGMHTLKQDGIEKVLMGHHAHQGSPRRLHQVKHTPR
jgi:type II secretory ATPase GspE/PulE/Tfp pilus assembly ATPase PilB-like protein